MSVVWRTHADESSRAFSRRPSRQVVQLEFDFDSCSRAGLSGRVGQHGNGAPWLQLVTRDADLERQARELLRVNGAGRIAGQVRVEWNPRLKSCAGRADYCQRLISLNPRLHAHGTTEVNRTFRHELAHLLAQFRAGRRRIQPHGSQWREACQDLGISGEKRCHNLPLPTSERPRRFLYRCPKCQSDFARARRIRRAIACLACCRAYNGGEFDPRFRLRLVAAS